MKNRPREESGMKRPLKRLLVVDEDDSDAEEVSLITPPIKLSKRPRKDETPRKSSFEALRVKDNNSEKTKAVTFCVLLPNGTSVELKMRELRKEIPIEEFIGVIRNEYDNQFSHKKFMTKKRKIIWDYQDLYFTDVNSNKIRLNVDFRKFSGSERKLLWLHDGSPEPEEYEGMWDLTPDTDLLKELPDDYTCETALADLIDNSLQALWSNATGQRRLISVEVEPEKITIFDSGPGMDGANGDIVKWGKMGASLHRSVKEKAIGSEPPYLMPFFGMFGYGGSVATMCLGRRAVVSSKRKESNKVYTLHMEREALVSASHSKDCWKTKGGVRDPLKDENLKSPHGSFTKVEIFDPKPKMKNLNLRQLQCKLKDIYFPYIQCDEMSGKTSTPIEFQVNGTYLTGIRGGEIATTNLLSCNGPDFTVQLHFRMRPESSSVADQNQRMSTTANARLKCVYFPITEGTENIQRVLDKLKEYGCGIRESFESFSRVSVRRLGRLLPDARWGLLPFMEPKQKKGEKAHTQKRICSRVKCFIDMDSGFNPTPQKTDLAHHHPYTKALKNFGNRASENEEEVQVEVTRDGKKLDLAQLEKLYHGWISEMHDRYDEETDVGLDKPTIIVVSSKDKKLDLTSNVLRVHKEIQRKGRCWTAGQNIKVLKGACSGCHNNNVYATLEYIVLEGLQGDPSSEARLICRPLGLPENKGCRLSVEQGNIHINDSCVFPIRIIDSDKCKAVDDIEWGSKLETFRQKLPAAIDLLSHADCQELEIDGEVPSSLEVGDRPPENIVAVIRPNSFDSGNSSKRLDQKFIVRDNFQMSLEIVKRRASDSDAGERDHVYSARLPASSHKNLRGLYIFQLNTKCPLLFQEPGIFMFRFSLTEHKDIQLEHEVQVRASADVGRWEILNHDKNELYTVRVGSCFKPLSIVCYDGYKKRIRFTSVPKLAIKLISNGNTLAEVCSKKVEITSDKSIMRIKEMIFTTSELDKIRPNYEATLQINTPDEAFSVALPCRVIPATPKRIIVHPTELEKQLFPGQIIEELALEVFDKYGNHVKENEDILLRLDGFSLQDGSGIIRGVGIDCMKKVDANGFIDLSNILKVSRGYGKRVVLSVLSKDKDAIFELHFKTEIRELRAAQKVFMRCEAGSQLENVVFEIVDSEGKVDESIHDGDKHGQPHTMTIKCESFPLDDSVQYRFHHGRCTIPSIPLPSTEGVFYFQAKHSRYPELHFAIKVHVEKTRQEYHDSVMNHEDVRSPIRPTKSLSPIPQNGSPDILQSQVAAQVPDGLYSSALISEKVHIEKQNQENLDNTNHKDVGNLIPSSRRSECEQILPVSPSLRVSQVMSGTFSLRNSNGSVSLINDSPVLKTPKSEHRDAQGQSSDRLCSKVSRSVQELEDDIANSALQRSRHEGNIKCLKPSLLRIQQDILQLQAVFGPDPSNPSSLCGHLSTLEIIQSRSQSAAAVICKMPKQEQKRLGIVGVVALIGTVESIELSRMLAQYLGKNQMLAIVCTDYAASHSLHKFASDRGLPIKGSYNAFCLEEIRPISREPNSDPQALLPLQHPTLPNGNEPRGFLGYAVNLISIEASHLQWRTESRHGLRETLFYRLFGKLQVYEDRNCMMVAQSCIEEGAVSLDGGVIRGNGLISLGIGEPKILFPVMKKPVMCPELEAKMLELAKIERQIDEENNAIQRLSEKLQLSLAKYNSYIFKSGAH